MKKVLLGWLRPCILRGHLAPSWGLTGRARPVKHFSDLVSIKNASFYKDYPIDGQESKDILLRDVNLKLQIADAKDADSVASERWAIVSPTSLGASTFLQILAGRHFCLPPTARSYPHLAAQSRPISQAINYVGFDAQRGSSVGGSSVRGAYLSARYESRVEVTDFSLLQYLTGQIDLNAPEYHQTNEEKTLLEQVIKQFNLKSLLDMPVANLSNGQTRRARIARALMLQPNLLLLDGPFMGLDPLSRSSISDLLESLSRDGKLVIIPSLRLGDVIPSWITHLVLLDEKGNISGQGERKIIEGQFKEILTSDSRAQPRDRAGRTSNNSVVKLTNQLRNVETGETLIEMQGVRVAYGDRAVLGDWEQEVDGETKSGLWWKLRRGERCAVFGPNGSGKTTLLSLITSDHPQSYSLPIKYFGRSRLPEVGTPGISLFDIQKRIGHSSPEIHAFFPRHLSVRRVLESAWAEAPLTRPILNSAIDRVVNAYLRYWARILNPARTEPTDIEKLLDHASFCSSAQRSKLNAQKLKYLLIDERDLDWAETITFGELSFSNQRLLLFLRAMIAEPDIVILDEALSGIDEEVRNRALEFLAWGESRQVHPVYKTLWKSPQEALGSVVAKGLTKDQALVVISHNRDDIPLFINDWICLPEPGEGKPPRMGALNEPIDEFAWARIWDQPAPRKVNNRTRKTQSRKI